MKNITIIRSEHRDNTQAVIVQDAFIGEHGPIDGCFEVFDVDDSTFYADGFVHINVMSCIVGQEADDATIQRLACRSRCRYQGDDGHHRRQQIPSGIGPRYLPQQALLMTAAEDTVVERLVGQGWPLRWL